jgi:hypothetical protein
MGWRMESSGSDALPVGERVLMKAEEQHRRAGDTESHVHLRMSNGVRARVAVLWVWGTAIAGAAFVLLGWAMSENYSAMGRRIDEQKIGLHNVVSIVQSHDRALAAIEANQQNVMLTQQRIEAKLDKLLEGRGR